MQYKFIEPPRDNQKAVAFMQDTMMPLLMEYWEKEGLSQFKRTFNFNVVSFVQMWLMGSLLIIIAYDNGKPAGFILGLRFVPVLFDARALQIEVSYTPTEELRKGIYEYLMTIVGFMGIDELWADPESLPDGVVTWPVASGYSVTRYVKD